MQRSTEKDSELIDYLIKSVIDLYQSVNHDCLIPNPLIDCVIVAIL